MPRVRSWVATIAARAASGSRPTAMAAQDTRRSPTERLRGQPEVLRQGRPGGERRRWSGAGGGRTAGHGRSAGAPAIRWDAGEPLGAVEPLGLAPGAPEPLALGATLGAALADGEADGLAATDGEGSGDGVARRREHPEAAEEHAVQEDHDEDPDHDPDERDRDPIVDVDGDLARCRGSRFGGRRRLPAGATGSTALPGSTGADGGRCRARGRDRVVRVARLAGSMRARSARLPSSDPVVGVECRWRRPRRRRRRPARTSRRRRPQPASRSRSVMG